MSAAPAAAATTTTTTTTTTMTKTGASAAAASKDASSATSAMSLTTRAAGAPAPDLLSINPYLYLYDPSAGPAAPASAGAASTTTGRANSATAHQPSLVPGVRAPAVILVFGFMDGSLRILQKYVAQYIARFPTSTLILQLSTGKGLFAPQEERASRMRKIVALLERAQERAESRRALRRRIRSLERNAAERSLDSGEQRRLRRLRKLQQRRASTASAAPSSGGEDETSAGVLDEDEDAADPDAADELYLKPEERTPRGLLIHSFSDGGARNLWALLNELSGSGDSNSAQQRPSADPRVPAVRGVIMDSSPGLQTASTSSMAFTMPLRKKYAAWIVWLARASVWIWVRFALLWRVYVRRLPTDSQRMRAALNAPSKWNWGWRASELALDDDPYYARRREPKNAWLLPPRLYLYSRADVLIPWNHVERHAKDAARIQAGGGVPAHSAIAEPELVLQEGDGNGRNGASSAASKAGNDADLEMARWAELSAKFDTSFSRERSSSGSASAHRAPANAKQVQARTQRGVRLVRWEKAAHCDLGRWDTPGYWAHLDAWLATV